MHPAPQFRWDDRGAMRALVADMGFGTLFVQTPDGPRVAHVPAIFTGQDSIAFHLANANLAARALDGANAVFVVTGPDAYISPDWYGLADQVPTWNYLAVELEGRVDAMPPAELPALIDALSADREARLAPKPPWTRDKMTPGLFDGMLGAITGYTLAVSAWRGTHKMGQNKPAHARLAVADALGSDPVAALMRESAL